MKQKGKFLLGVFAAVVVLGGAACNPAEETDSVEPKTEKVVESVGRAVEESKDALSNLGTAYFLYQQRLASGSMPRRRSHLIEGAE